MSREENVRVVTRYFENMNKGDAAAALSETTDDFVYVVPFRTEYFPMGGSRDKAGILALMESLTGSFETMAIAMGEVIAEGDRVIVEAKSDARSHSGAKYNNRYSMNFRLRDGRIAEVVEFCDPFEVVEYQRLSQLA